MGYILQFCLRLLSFLPLKAHYALGRFVSWLAEKVFRYRTDVVSANLARSFPEMDYKELKQVKDRFYRHLGEQIGEFVWFGGCRSVERLHRQHLVEIENPEEINRLYELSPSVMILMSHTGNWELIGGIQSYNYSGMHLHINERNYAVVYLPQSSGTWNRIFKSNRIANLYDPGNVPGYLETGKVLRFVLEHKAEKIMYNFITDQHPYIEAKGRMEVDFLNQRCQSMKGAAEIARKLGMSVCYLSMPQERRGLYKIRYIPICDNASAMSAEDIMKQYYKLLEEDIKAQPWNYLWTHRRWKKPGKTLGT